MPASSPTDLRNHVLETASRLFYRQGVRAVGVDLVVQEAGVAKTSLYRHFPTKDDLIVAFLEREDAAIWARWDEVVAPHATDPLAALDAVMTWIGADLARDDYRGCPQINVAGEFADPAHPSRAVAHRHMQRLTERMTGLARQLDVAQPEQLGIQLAVLVNGAFAGAGLLQPAPESATLRAAGRALCAAAGAAS